MAAIYSSQSDHKKAIDYYSQSLLITQRVKGKDSADAALILDSLGVAYQR